MIRKTVIAHAVFAVATLMLIHGAFAADSRSSGEVRITGAAIVLDGDTLEIQGHRIRLYGVDAPESGQRCKRGNDTAWPCGTAAKAALAKLVDGLRVDCVQRDVDRYRRVVAVCSAGAGEINAALARQGWALAYREYSSDYVDEEEAARSARAGLWSSTFENPWDYRKQQQARADNAPVARSTNCTIKGNISSGGDRIYHIKGGEFYQRTQINTSQGERWFCTEDEAVRAGWRKSRQ